MTCIFYSSFNFLVLLKELIYLSRFLLLIFLLLIYSFSQILFCHLKHFFCGYFSFLYLHTLISVFFIYIRSSIADHFCRLINLRKQPPLILLVLSIDLKIWFCSFLYYIFQSCFLYFIVAVFLAS